MILEYFKKARPQKHYDERNNDKLDTEDHVWHHAIYMKCAEAANPQTGSRSVAARGWGRGWRVTARRDMVCFEGDRNILELDRDDDHTTLQMYVATELCP